MKETDFHSHIKEMVLSVCGINFAEIGHSTEISRKIFAKDKNYISEINIRRFFFLPNEPYTSSLFILNSLSMFVGAASWEEFKVKTVRRVDTNKIHCSCMKTSAWELTGGMETFVYTFGKFNRYHSQLSFGTAVSAVDIIYTFAIQQPCARCLWKLKLQG